MAAGGSLPSGAVSASLRTYAPITLHPTPTSLFFRGALRLPCVLASTRHCSSRCNPPHAQKNNRTLENSLPEHLSCPSSPPLSPSPSPQFPLNLMSTAAHSLARCGNYRPVGRYPSAPWWRRGWARGWCHLSWRCFKGSSDASVECQCTHRFETQSNGSNGPGR